MQPSQAHRHIKSIVGDNLKRARQERGWTQAQLAVELGGDSTAISRWERGRVKPDDDSLTTLAQVLGKDFAWFFVDRAGENDPEPLAA